MVLPVLGQWFGYFSSIANRMDDFALLRRKKNGKRWDTGSIIAMADLFSHYLASPRPGS